MKHIKQIILLGLSISLLSSCTSNNDKEALSRSVGWPDNGESGFINVEGGRVLYHYYGKNKKNTPIIFLHGGPGADGAYFFKQIPLAENNPVLIYNQLGSDGSDYTKGTTLEEAQELMNIEHYVDELDTVIKHFKFKEYILVGSSWGCMLAVEYAASKAPSGLKGIVNNGPFLSVDVWCDDQERLIKSLPEYDVCGEMMDGERMWEVIQECENNQTYYEDDRYSRIDDIYCDNFNRRPENDPYIGEKPSDADVSEYIIEGLSVYDYMWGPSEFSCLGTLAHHDSTPLLSSINVPILYLCGQYDAGSKEAAEIYKAKSNDAEIVVIEGCAHSSAREKSEEFNTAIKNFLNKIS